MPAIERSEAEIVVVHDADVWAEGLDEAILAVRNGAPWAIPHRGVFRLTERGTDEFLATGSSDDLEQRAYLGIEGGGVVVARREALLDVPLDPRFVGWGQEDESWGLALRTLLGPPERVKRPLIHLYHPPQRRLTRSRGSMEGWALRRRYYLARHDPDAMRNLISEAHAALATPESRLHDHQTAGVD